jgi:predicted dehydrogenase
VKALMAGLGGVGQRHLRNLRALTGGDTTVLAYRSRGLSHVLTDTLDVSPGRDLAAEYDIAEFDNLDDALAERPDITLVCNPTSLHVPVALAAARAGSHLFIEKPLSHDTEGIDELAQEVASRHLVALVGYQLRFHPCLRALRVLLERRVVGRVVAARLEVGEYLPGWHQYEDYRRMYAARQDQGGGVILSQIHELDYACWLFGPPTRVFAVGGHLSRLDIDVEDTASILMECTVDGRAIPVHVHQDYLQRPASRTCQVIGDAGKILVDLREPSVRLFDGEGHPVQIDPIPPFERNQLFLDEMTHFLACVRGEQTPLVSLADAARSLRIALAAKRSLVTRHVVEMDSV